MARQPVVDFSVFDLQWNVQDDYSGTAAKEAKKLIDSGTSMHIDGRAGTGKTYLLNEIRKELDARSIKYAGFSPTNKGARLIGGNTIHSIFYKYQTNKRSLVTAMEKIDYIFVDEVSMMVKDFYELFTLIKRSFATMKFIIGGDYAQLSPVNDNWEGNYKNSPALNILCDGSCVQLTKCRRADRKLFDLCANVASIDIADFTATEPTYLNLAYTHDTRKRVNNDCMNRSSKNITRQLCLYRKTEITRKPKMVD